MKQKQAHRRYMKLFVPAMIIYVLGVFGVAYLRANTNVSLPGLAVLSLIPALAMLAWIWGHWRYINELDEYLQKLQLQAIMAGLGIVMSVAAVWGLLEELVKDPGFPTIPIFYVVPVFYAIYGLAYVVIGKRAGVKGGYL